MDNPNLKVKRRQGSWWITGLPVDHDDGQTGVGPYERRADADDDRRGLERFYRVEINRSSTRTGRVPQFE